MGVDGFVQPEVQRVTGVDPSIARVPTPYTVSSVTQFSLPSAPMQESFYCIYHPTFDGEKCQHRGNVEMF